MSRLTLIHWNAAEARDRARALRRGKHRVKTIVPVPDGTLRTALAEDPPDAFLVDLTRLPSHGRQIAGWLRERKATRMVPLLFVGGEPDKVARTRLVFPDAAFSQWPGVEAAVKKAISRPPAQPVRPGVMAGYSGTPLPKKLGIKAGSRVALLGAPDGYEETLGALPEGAQLSAQLRGNPDLAVLFVDSRAELDKRFTPLARAIAPGGSLWIAWPKKASGVPTDLAEPFVREYGLAANWVDFKICAIDQTWSGLRFARRR